MRFEKLENTLRNEEVIPKCKILMVKEYHRTPEVDNDYHYHILIIRELGLSKNKYQKKFREYFPLFEGRSLDVQGAKSINGSISYILKRVHLTEVLVLIDTKDCTEHIITDEIKYWFSKIKAVSFIKTSFIMHSILKHRSLKVWRVACAEHTFLYTKSPKGMQQI